MEAELRKGKSPKYYEIKRTQSKKKLGWTASVDEIEQDMDDISDDDNSRNETVPMILIVVQGGPNTLLTVEESLKQNVPVLVLAVCFLFILKGLHSKHGNLVLIFIEF